jgi:DNA-binding MarR family transcriptional regulator
MLRDNTRNEQVLIALRRITHAIDIHSRNVFLRNNLTGPQIFVLQEIHRNEGVSVRELSGWVESNRYAVWDILDRLEKRGLVRRMASGDDPASATLFLTDAGRDTLRDSPPLLQEHFFGEFEKLDEWEQSLILSTLQRIASMLEMQAEEIA